MTEEPIDIDDIFGEPAHPQSQQQPKPSPVTPRKTGRPPDYTKMLDFGNYKLSMSIWIKQGSAILVVSVFQNNKWYVKVKEELKAWRVSK